LPDLVNEIEPGHVPEVEAHDEHPGMPGQHRGGGKKAFAARLRFADEVQVRIGFNRPTNGCAPLRIIMDKEDINHFKVGSKAERAVRKDFAPAG
jgi:hypothetical protein